MTVTVTVTKMVLFEKKQTQLVPIILGDYTDFHGDSLRKNKRNDTIKSEILNDGLVDCACVLKL